MLVGKRMGMFDWTGFIKSVGGTPDLTQYFEKDLVKAISECLCGCTNVLEVGCGNGRWLRWFQNRYGRSMFGIDSCPVGFTAKDVNFVLGDAFNLPFPEKVYYVVCSFGLIEHFSFEERQNLLTSKSEC
jgi:ubiquinone/menaquinone biosynthesis C-methylase UbiE